MEDHKKIKRKPLKDCIVKPGEKSPFANLLVDLAFKKAFNPDKPASRQNLVNLLNDLLEPQLKRPIVTAKTRNVAHNLSGSKVSRTAIFDLHCKDDMVKELPAELDERKFESLTESSKVSKFSKEEFEAYQKMFHEKWDHNVLKDSFFEEFADEINAKVDAVSSERVLDKTREMAKAMREQGIPDSTIAIISGLSEEQINQL